MSASEKVEMPEDIKQQETPEAPKSLKDFIILWAGQVVSIIGSGLTGFALGVHVFQETGSATYYAMIILCTTLPGIIFRPFAGVIADRYNRKTVMLISDFAAALCTLFIAAMFWMGKLELWHIFVGMSLNSICNSFQNPAYMAGITQLIPKNFYAQASGMIQAAGSTRFLISPLLAGLLMGVIGLNGIIIIDFATFLIAVISMLLVKIPNVKKTQEGGGGDEVSAIDQLKGGFSYLFKRSGLMMLIFAIAIANFFMGFLVALIGPMILSFATEELLGIGQSLAASGMLISSVLIGIKGIPKDQVKTILICFVILGIGFGGTGVSTNLFAIAIPCFLFFFALPYINSSIHTILRRKVVHDMQGRVFSSMEMVLQMGSVLAYIVAGPLADNVFTPLLLEGGPLASTVGQIIGVGPGRGIGFLFILSGLMIVLFCLVMFSLPKIRNLENDLPDVIQD